VSKYRLTPSARRDLIAIWRFIALDSVDAADRVEAAIHDSCDMLAGSPMAGRSVPGATHLPVRLWTVASYRNYTLVYAPDTKPLRVVRILHGAQEIRRQLMRL